MSRFLALILTTLMLAACSTTAPRMTENGGFVARELQLHGQTHRYQVFVPAQRGARGTTPVILFLHGSGERGDDGLKQTEAGLGPYLRTHAASFPAIVVFPQSPADQSWQGETAELAMATLEAASREFGADPKRTYLTGMSRGGYGTYELAMLHPDRFAALVPVCGGITQPGIDEPLRVAAAESDDPFATAAQRLKHLPIWIFHGGKDDLVPPEQSRRMQAALQAVGGNVQYTEFADANHNSWDPTYRYAPLWEWLWQQERK